MLQAFGAELISDPETNSVTVGPAQLRANGSCPRRYQLSCILVSGWSDCTGSELLIENVGVNPTRTGILEPYQCGGRHSARKSAGCCR